MIKKKPKSTVTCIAWHPNNQLIAVGSCDFRCRFVFLFRKINVIQKKKIIAFFLFYRIYSAFIKAVDGQPQSSNWGSIKSTGELLHEFQSGVFYFTLRKDFGNKNYVYYRIRLAS